MRQRTRDEINPIEGINLLLILHSRDDNKEGG